MRLNRTTKRLVIQVATCGSAFLLLCPVVKATPVNTPYDSIVCFNATFNECLSTVAGFNRSAYLSAYFNSPNGPLTLKVSDFLGPLSTTGSYTTASGLVVTHACLFPSTIYSPQLNVDTKHSVVFISPELLHEIADRILSIRRTRGVCQNLINSFNNDVRLYGLRGSIYKYSSGIANISAQISSELSAKEAVGTAAISPPDAASYGLASVASEADALRTLHTNDSSQERSVYTTLEDSLMSDNYAGQFSDAQGLLNIQTNDLSGDLFLLDRSTFDSGKGFAKSAEVSSGSWVQKGYVVGNEK